MEIFAGTCAIFGASIFCEKKKRKNSNRLTDKYREEKFDVASLSIFFQAAHYFP